MLWDGTEARLFREEARCILEWSHYLYFVCEKLFHAKRRSLFGWNDAVNILNVLSYCSVDSASSADVDRTRSNSISLHLSLSLSLSCLLREGQERQLVRLQLRNGQVPGPLQLDANDAAVDAPRDGDVDLGIVVGQINGVAGGGLGLL